MRRPWTRRTRVLRSLPGRSGSRCCNRRTRRRHLNRGPGRRRRRRNCGGRFREIGWQRRTWTRQDLAGTRRGRNRLRRHRHGGPCRRCGRRRDTGGRARNGRLSRGWRRRCGRGSGHGRWDGMESGRSRRLKTLARQRRTDRFRLDRSWRRRGHGCGLDSGRLDGGFRFLHRGFGLRSGRNGLRDGLFRLSFMP